MYGVLESVRNSTFRNPFVTPVNCESAADNSTQNLVAGRTIAAASVAEGGIDLHKYAMSYDVTIIPSFKHKSIQDFQQILFISIY